MIPRLDDIVDATRDALKRRQREHPLSELEAQVETGREGRPFAEALSRPGTSLIAEHKRRSPSAGDLAPSGSSCAEIVQAYERGGAAAVSILTEEVHFGGSLADLREARAATELPILRKDFTIDPYQLYEAKLAGADAVLLVVGSLDDSMLASLYAEARQLDLDALVEIHDDEELERALELDSDVIGINNRNLEDFSVDIQRTFDLLADVPAGKVVVSESGIHHRDQIDELEQVGVDAVLIGEALMRSPDPRDGSARAHALDRSWRGTHRPRLGVSLPWWCMSTVPELDPPAVAELGARLRDNIARAVKAPDSVIRDVLVALFAEGHVLIEDYPGVGKTALARALARSVDAEYARIQCTADLLPADVVGTNVYDQRENRFEFRPGPVFANVVLVDEVNRASPKTQSGLLECMQEGHVTVDRHTHELARPFIVVATQNPVEYEGTYPLPEAQLDRFMVRVSLGYPTAQQESDMLMDHAASDRVLDLEPVADVAGILAAQNAASAVHGSEALRRYVVAISDATRADPRVELGASPRAGLMLFRAAKAYAALDGRDHALPDDVQKLAGAVLTHRLLLAPGSGADERAAVVRDALERVPAL